MKKLIVLMFVFSCAFAVHAQDSTDTQSSKTKIKTDGSKTKTKDDKSKMKDDEGKIKIKDNTDMNTDTDSKTKIKDNKTKIKDADGKVKIKGDNNMSTSNSGMGTMSTSTNVNVVTVEGWKTNPANLPVIGNGVSADVVSTMKNKYGSSIYDIKEMKSSSGQMMYAVRVMDNGTMRTDYVGADGSTVSQ